jgi:hypothetical protein
MVDAVATNPAVLDGKPRLAEGGKYMRHIPSGRVYPYEVNGAKREDVEVFIHKKTGDQKLAKPKVKPKGPFAREGGANTFGGAADRVIDAN